MIYKFACIHSAARSGVTKVALLFAAPPVSQEANEQEGASMAADAGCGV